MKFRRLLVAAAALVLPLSVAAPASANIPHPAPAAPKPIWPVQGSWVCKAKDAKISDGGKTIVCNGRRLTAQARWIFVIRGDDVYLVPDPSNYMNPAAWLWVW